MDKSAKNQNHLLLTMHNTNTITNTIEKMIENISKRTC